jgi:hypothetical protein
LEREREGGYFWAYEYSGLISVDTPFHYFGFMSLFMYILFIYYDLEIWLAFASRSTIPEEVVPYVLSDSGSEMRGFWVNEGKSVTRLVTANAVYW